jgi:hypothetical protein
MKKVQLNSRGIFMYCRSCSSTINDKAEYCTSCGCRPLSDTKYCQECGVETNSKQEICVKCGVRLRNSSSVHSGNNTSFSNITKGDGSLNLDFSYLDPYYQAEFTKIYESNETYKGNWNWYSFFFSGIWSLSKGVWLSPLTVFLVSVFTFGIPAIVYCILCGTRGTYMYYNSFVKKKQLFF